MKKRVNSVELPRARTAKVRPVVPTFTARSLVAIPLLKSTPVITKVGFEAPFVIVAELTVIDFGAVTETLIELLAAAGATVKAEVAA